MTMFRTKKIINRRFNKIPYTGPAGYVANATAFNVTNSVYHATAFTSAVNGKLGIMSFWCRFHGNVGTQCKVISFSGQDFELLKLTTEILRIKIYDSTDTTLSLEMTSTATVNDGAWHHILMAWDMTSSTKCHFVIDGVEGTSIATCLNNNLYYAAAVNYVGYDDPTTGPIVDFSEVYVNTAEWLDITVSANVQKFRSLAGKPVSLGSDGSSPTGLQPMVYLKDPYTTFKTNYGSGGNFPTVAGTLASATPP